MPRIGINVGIGNTSIMGGLSFGANIITNGGFDADTDWTLSAGWAIAGGVLSADGTGTAGENALQGAGAANSTTYRLEFGMSNYISGNLDVIVGSVNLADMAENGHYSVDFTTAASQNGVLFLQTYSLIADIDNVVLREIL